MPENKLIRPKDPDARLMPSNDAYLKTANFEGYEPKVYLDSRKKKTIGYGFNLDEPTVKDYFTKKGYNYKALVTGKQGLSKSQSNAILKDLYNDSYQNTKKIIKNFETLPENVKNVLTDLNYNLGTTKMQKFSKMISAIEKQDFKTAAEELKNSNYYNQTGRRARSHYETLSNVPLNIQPKEVKTYSPSWLDIAQEIFAAPALAPVIIGQKVADSFFKEGGLIKRADGSYSKRGLWDNIRANRGSGKKPTPAMLKQERKIRRAEKKEDGGLIESYENGGWLESYENGGWLDSYEDGSEVTSNPLMNLSESQRFPKQAERTVVYPKGYIQNRINPNAPLIPLNFIGQPYATGAIEESMSPLDLVGGVRGGANLVKGALKYRQAMKPNYIQIGDELFNIGPHPRSVRRATKQMHKGVRDLVLPNAFEYGGSINDQRIPTPTSPSSYPDYTNPTLTNYQMGTPKSNLPIRGLRDATPDIPAYAYGGIIPMYAAGATVWTKQDTPTWAAGTPTPTATQNFKNTNSINTSRYRIGDVIPTGMDYKKPSAGTKDYSRVMTSYDWNNQRRLHAPDTTIMRDGGKITEDYKKRKGIPYAIHPGISNAGMYVGPTTQRGITFADGGPTGTIPSFKPGETYVQGWYKSPMYKSIIEKQAAQLYSDNPKKAAKYIKLFTGTEGSVAPPKIIKNLQKKQNVYGIATEGYLALDKDFVTNNPQLANSLYAHELMHDNSNTQYDYDFISKQTPKFDKTIHPGGILGRATPEERYLGLTSPDEVRAQIHSIRALGKEHGVYDPFNQPFTKDYLEKINTIYNSGDFDGKNYNQLQRLRDYYSEDQIIDMMNTISQNKNTTLNPPMAKNGGWLDNL